MSLRHILFATALIGAAPALAQYQSEGYKFLQAVREAKDNDVIAALNKPGVTLVNTRDVTTGEAALHITVRRGDVPYTASLLKKGADPNIRDGKRNTPMIIAIESGHGELVPLLLLGKADPNLANASGVTPLIRAAQMRDSEAARALIGAKANPDQKDYSGLSAREYVERDGRSATLLKLFADTPRQNRPAVAGPKL